MNNKDKHDYTVDEQNKIYILGGRGVGKTSFFHLLFSKKFKEEQPSKTGIIIGNYRKGRQRFTIKELTDDENFSKTKFLKNELEDVILIFILFSIDDKSSYDHAKLLIQFIKNNLINNKELNIILVGNKYDVGENNPDAIQVKRREVDKYIHNIEHIFYFEISCKTNHNFSQIKELIESIEINDGGNEQYNEEISDENEKKKKKNNTNNESCLIF